jgi:chorismate synthase
VFRVAIKPPSSIAKNQKTVNLREIREADLVVKGRHDPCTAVRAPVIVECAAAFCLADFMLEAQEIPRVLERKKGGV